MLTFLGSGGAAASAFYVLWASFLQSRWWVVRPVPGRGPSTITLLWDDSEGGEPRSGPLNPDPLIGSN